MNFQLLTKGLHALLQGTLQRVSKVILSPSKCCADTYVTLSMALITFTNTCYPKVQPPTFFCQEEE